MDQFCTTTNRFYNTVELHLSGLIGMVSHPDMQKIQIIGFFFENRPHWQFQVHLFFFFIIRAWSICPRCTTAYRLIAWPSYPRDFRRSHFLRQAPPCPYDARDPSSERWNCGRECWPVILPKCHFHISFRDLFHVAKLRNGTDGFISPLKEGVLRIFSPWKILTASAGFEPVNLGT